MNNWNKIDKEKDKRIEELKKQHREYFSTNYTHFTPKRLKDYEKQ
jgi:hypothetical protein